MKKGFFNYNNKEELFLHATDKMADFMERAESDRNNAELYYAAALLACRPEWPAPKKEYAGRLAKVLMLLPNNISTDEVLWLNNYMHILHTNSPDLRRKALTLIDNERVYFEWSGLNGHSPFPEILEEYVTHILEPYKDDVAYKMGVTWSFSHFSEGRDYDYSVDEEAYIDLFGSEKFLLESIKNKLEEIKIAHPSYETMEGQETLNIIVKSTSEISEVEKQISAAIKKGDINALEEINEKMLYVSEENYNDLEILIESIKSFRSEEN